MKLTEGSGASSPLGVAVVGAGYWGPNLARNFSASPEWDLRWVCDLDTDRARRIAGPSTEVSEDVAEALADRKLHAVAIATPANTHSAIALQAIEAGKHVLIEKPLACTYSDGEAIIGAADRQGVVVMCDHTFCYTPAVECLRSIVAEGTLGDIQYFDSVRINLGLVQRDVDVLWDLAPHDLSILDFVLPDGLRPVAVAAHGADPIGAGQTCVAYLTLQLPGDAIAHVHVNWLSPIKVRTTMVGGSNGRALGRHEPGSAGLGVRSRGGHGPKEALDLTRVTSRIAYRTGDMHAPALSDREALATMVEEFAAAIREVAPRARTAGPVCGCWTSSRQRVKVWRSRVRWSRCGPGEAEDDQRGSRCRGRRALRPGDWRGGHDRKSRGGPPGRGRSQRVVVLDDLTRGREENLATAESSGRVELVVGDIRDVNLVHRLTEGCDAVPPRAIRITQCEDPRLAHDVLATGTFNFLRQRGRRRAQGDRVQFGLVYGLAEVFRPRRTTRGPTTRSTVRPRSTTRACCAVSTPCRGLTTLLCGTSTSTGPGWTSTGSTPRCSSDGWNGSQTVSRPSSSATGCRPWTSSTSVTSHGRTSLLSSRRLPTASTTLHCLIGRDQSAGPGGSAERGDGACRPGAYFRPRTIGEPGEPPVGGHVRCRSGSGLECGNPFG